MILSANTTGLSDDDGIGTLDFQWLRGGLPVGTNNSTYTLDDADVGQVMAVTVSFTDNNGTPESTTSADTAAVTNVNDSPTGGVSVTATPAGVFAQGSTLNADTSALVDEDGLGAFSYQWKKNTVDLGGETGTTYVLVNDDVDDTFTVEVTYTDLRSTPETVLSSATPVIANVNDPPVISDPPAVLDVGIGEAFNHTPTASDPDQLTAAGEVLTFSLDTPAGASWLGISSTTGELSGTPTAGDIGPEPVSVRVSDDEGLSATLDFTLTITSAGTVLVSWTAPTLRANGDPIAPGEIDHYEVSYREGANPPIIGTTTGDETTFVTPVLAPGTYFFQVNAIDFWTLESGFTADEELTI